MFLDGGDGHTPRAAEGRVTAHSSALFCPQVGGCSLARRKEKVLSFSESLPQSYHQTGDRATRQPSWAAPKRSHGIGLCTFFSPLRKNFLEFLLH